MRLQAGEWLKSELGFETHRHISSAVSGKIKTAYGFHWENINCG